MKFHYFAQHCSKEKIHFKTCAILQCPVLMCSFLFTHFSIIVFKITFIYFQFILENVNKLEKQIVLNLDISWSWHFTRLYMNWFNPKINGKRQRGHRCFLSKDYSRFKSSLQVSIIMSGDICHSLANIFFQKCLDLKFRIIEWTHSLKLSKF